MSRSLKKKALVTGATGFVGSHLTRRLVADGWEVHIIVRPVDDYSLIKDLSGRVSMHIHDGSTNGMAEIVGKAGPSAVFHLASMFLASHGPDDIEPLVRSNILFGTQLVDAMAANGVYRLVNTGTSWQHYENKKYSPVCLYAATKQAFEALLEFYTETTPMRAITLKLFDTYGPGDPRPKLFNLLNKVAMERKPLAMSQGEQLIDLVYINDVVDAFMISAGLLDKKTAKTHRCYAVSSGKPMSLREIVELYSQKTGSPLPIEWGGRPYREREVMVPWDKGVAVPGWKPRVSIEEGVEIMAGDLKI